MGDIQIYGSCDARFASVRDAFEDNFEQGRELGAAFYRSRGNYGLYFTLWDRWMGTLVR